MKLCTKNYENQLIFVKVTATKSMVPFLCGHGVEVTARNKAGNWFTFDRTEN